MASAKDVFNVINNSLLEEKIWQEKYKGFYDSKVQPFDKSMLDKTWGNDKIELSKSDIAYLLLGGELFFFDGEYGHKIVLGKE